MKIILLTRDDLEHRYVANKLAGSISLSAIIVDKGRPSSMSKRYRSLLRKYTFSQLFSKFLSRAISICCRDKTHRRREICDVLGSDNCRRHLHTDKIIYVNGLNSPAAFETIKDLNPDVILIYGTSMVSDSVLNLARQASLNMHTGMSPYYRGSACAFWPLYNEQLDMLGATVHQCTSEIDGGLIYEVAQAKLAPDDGIFAVFARTVQVGTQLYIKTVQSLLGGTLHGYKQQHHLGREYRAAMKSWQRELAVRIKIRKGLVRDYAKNQPEIIPITI